MTLKVKSINQWSELAKISTEMQKIILCTDIIVKMWNVWHVSPKVPNDYDNGEDYTETHIKLEIHIFSSSKYLVRVFSKLFLLWGLCPDSIFTIFYVSSERATAIPDFRRFL